MSQYNFDGIEDAANENTAYANQVIAKNNKQGTYDFSGVDQLLTEQKYGTPTEQLKAGAEATARGASLGTSDWLLTRSGVTSPEAIRARQQANPKTALLGNIAGTTGLLIGTGGLAAPAEGALVGAEILGPTAARIAGFGLEGAALGAGNVVSDASLGDVDINAQKILADVGMGAAFGAGLGALSKGIEAIPSLKRTAVSEIQSADAALAKDLGISVTEKPVMDAPEGSFGIKPTSIEDMQARVKDASYRGESVELPQKQALQDAASRVEMMNPVHPLQLESLDTQAARDIYKTAIEMPGKEGDAIRAYEAIQKKELTKITDNAIKSVVTDGSKVVEDAVEGGKKAIDAFTKQYQEEKSALAPVFEKLKTFETKDPFNHLPQVITKLTDTLPNVARMFDTAAEEIGAIKPYKSNMGLDRATYNAVKDVVESLKEPAFLEDLMNIRKGMSQHVDVLAQGEAPAQIRALKASMMEYIQAEAEKVGALNGENSIREVFKRYAINEQERQVIEKNFGASVGSQEFGSISKIKPEKILDNIFRDTASVNAAKNILGPEKFNEMLANYLAGERAWATKDGVFSSNKFGTFLKNKADVLNEAFKENPTALQKIRDVNVVSRILPDSPSINPSGTAKTLWGTLKAHSIADFVGNLKGYAGEKLQEHLVRQKINEGLAGKADHATKLGTIQKIIKKTSDKINDAAKSVLGEGARGSIPSAVKGISDEEFTERIKRIKELSNNPSALMDHMGKSTDGLYASAPNITQGVNATMIRAITFLSSKLPVAKNSMPLSKEHVISDAEKQKFNNYFNVVNDPVSVLSTIKSGTLTNDSIEALQAVHPNLYGEMKKALIFHFDPEKAVDLKYPEKIALSKFLGQPLDENMLPQSIMSYQQALAGPNLSSQSGPSDRDLKIQQSMQKRTSTQTQDLERSDV